MAKRVMKIWYRFVNEYGGQVTIFRVWQYIKKGESMTVIEFYCQKYLMRFGVKPERVGKEDKFKVGSETLTISDIERRIYPPKKMSEETKEKLKGYSGKKEAIKKRAKELLKGKSTELLLV